VRHVIGALLEHESTVTVVDLEAGLEHLSRGTSRHVDTLIVTLEPYYKSLETARRSAELAREIGVPRVVAVANKTRDEDDRAAIREFAAGHGLTLVADVPMDDRIHRAGVAGRAPIDQTDSPAVLAIAQLATGSDDGSIEREIADC
jgi:CO dehydrogenase maturation factor